MNLFPISERNWRWLHAALSASHTLLALLCLGLATHLRDPHLLPLRAYEAPVLLVLAALGLIVTLSPLLWRGRWPEWRLLVWLGIVVLVIADEHAAIRQKQTVAEARGETAARLRQVGKHLIIGYGRAADVQDLVSRGFVAGLFVTRRNAVGKSVAQLRDEISDLQERRRQAGLPPLIIASDQEGGAVSRLSPPLPRQAALASLLTPGASRAEIEQRAADYGTAQGEALRALGVNVNFSPVVDLQPGTAAGALDFHTRIAERAIAADPEIVTAVALAYSRGLASRGVLPTLKHFPGLGSVSGDTHHFSAHLQLSREALEARDWRPFRHILGQSPALLMVGHVIVDVVDAERPASLSTKLIAGVVRTEWQFKGIIVSDDLTMAATYNRGLCASSIAALNAGVDWLLLAYDWEKIYPVLACLHRADQAGQLLPRADAPLPM